MRLADKIYFAEFIFPIVVLDNGASIDRFLGTGFFIGKEGHFLTCKHVIDEAVFAANPYLAIILELTTDKIEYRLLNVTAVESHPEADFCVGKVELGTHRPEKFFSLRYESDAYGWEDLHSFGYPDHQFKDGQAIKMHAEFLKGYIIARFGKNTYSDERLSFPGHLVSCAIPKGMSGSPAFKIGSEKALVGICLGSYESATTLYKIEEYKDKETEFQEKVQKVVENGLVLRIYEFRDFFLNVFQKKLSDIIG